MYYNCVALGMSDRGVSSPVGIVLILGITIASVAVLFGVGGTVVSDTRADAERSQMENSMSGFSSKASLVGLGEASDQRFSLGRASEGQVDIREDAGRVTVYVERPDGTTDHIGTTSMGAVIYRSGEREIAYQGGGVWERQNDFSRMISPPEFHYRAETLTFPILNVTGSGSATGDVRGTVRAGGTSRQLYPNTDENTDFINPLTDGTVYVEVESEYCRGWESFFEARSQGLVEGTCGEDSTVTVALESSLDPIFGNIVTAGNIEIDPEKNRGGGGRPNIDGPTREGIAAPSASDDIDARISGCLPNECSSMDTDDDLTEGTYYTEDPSDIGDLTIDVNSGDVDVILNTTGDVDLGDIEVLGDGGTASLYVKSDGDIDISEDVNSAEEGENPPSRFIMYVHSDVPEIHLVGNEEYRGGLYAPNSDLNGNKGSGSGCGGGSVSLTGSVVVDNFCFRNGDFIHDPGMNDIDLELNANTIKYLHISENEVDVELN